MGYKVVFHNLSAMPAGVIYVALTRVRDFLTLSVHGVLSYGFGCT